MQYSQNLTKGDSKCRLKTRFLRNDWKGEERKNKQRLTPLKHSNTKIGRFKELTSIISLMLDVIKHNSNSKERSA